MTALARRPVPIGRWTTEYVAGFLSTQEAADALRFVRGLPFHHYKSRGVTLRRGMYEFGVSYPPTGSIGPAESIPDALSRLRDRVDEHCDARFDQLIVTWYPPGAGIGIHCDHVKWFSDPIAGVSLEGDGVLRGTHAELGVMDQHVAAGSLYVLRGVERYDWKHELRLTRSDRYSLTFRSLTDEARARIEQAIAEA